MLPVKLITTTLDLAKNSNVVLTERVLISGIRGCVILGLGGLICKGLDILSKNYNEMTIEGRTENGKAITVKGKRI